MNVVIGGAGSIGTVLGTLLSDAGENVKLLRRRGPWGLTTMSIAGQLELSREVEVISEVHDTVDIIFITVQEQHTAAFCREMAGTIGPDVILVSLQNGTSSPKVLLEHFPQNRIISGSVWWSAALIDCNRVLYHRKADTVIGIPQGSVASDDDLNRVAALLDQVLEVRTTDDIEKELRTKLILNVVSPVLALVKGSYPEGLAAEVTRRVVHALFDEALETADLLDWNINEEDSRLLGFHIKLAEGGFDEGSEGTGYRHKVSTQLGIEKYGGRSSNVDQLLGWLQLSGSVLADEVIQMVHSLQQDYDPVGQEVLLALLNQTKYAKCRIGVDFFDN